MPGTHLLPPNLLKLFAPRPPLPYTRPLDKDIDRVKPKNVDGVGPLLAMLREVKTQGMMESGNTGGEREGMEEGEEPSFTYAEETKRQIRREEKMKKKAEEFQRAKDNCMWLFLPLVLLLTVLQTSPRTIRRPLETLTKRFSSRAWYVRCPPLP